MRILVAGILTGPDIIIRILGEIDENSGMTVGSFARTNENSGETKVHTDGEKSLKIDGNYGMIGKSYNGMHGDFNTTDLHGSQDLRLRGENSMLRV